MAKVARFLAIFALVTLFVVGTTDSAHADTTEAGAYGSGDYGSCDYGTCGITLTSSGSTNVDIVPTSTGKCTVQSDTVSVQTGNSSGYTVTMTTDAANNALIGSSDSITASNGTADVPATLAMNTWGYRVDGLASFGNGPTAAQSSGGVPGVQFAGVPNNTQQGTAVMSSDAAAETAENATVWYGACADATLPAGGYSTTVIYTAIASE